MIARAGSRARRRYCVRSPAMGAAVEQAVEHGLSLPPFRGLRPAVDEQRLGRLLSPPYDVIDAGTRERLLAADPDNAVGVLLPEPTPSGYAAAADRFAGWVADGLLAPDPVPAL